MSPVEHPLPDVTSMPLADLLADTVLDEALRRVVREAQEPESYTAFGSAAEVTE